MALLLHKGGEEVKKEDLALIPLPLETESYTPVSHYDLANSLSTIGQDILTDYTLVGETYALARQGQQMFAFLKFQSDQQDTALSFAFRNSYDRSMSIGFAAGLSVFCCDNLALNGDIVVMKKHTKNIFLSLEDSAITTLYKAQLQYKGLLRDKSRMSQITLTNDEVFRAIGLLYGRGVISPRQIPVIRDEWLKPSHQEFEPRTMWSFYNSVTEALKTTPPLSIMERTIKLHNLAMGEIIEADYEEI